MSGFSPMPRQMDLLRFIAGYVEAHGKSPTHLEMAHALGQRHKGSVNRMLNLLEERGLIRRQRSQARSQRFRPVPIEVIEHPVLPRAPDGAPLRFIPVGQLQP